MHSSSAQECLWSQQDCNSKAIINEAFLTVVIHFCARNCLVSQLCTHQEFPFLTQPLTCSREVEIFNSKSLPFPFYVNQIIRQAMLNLKRKQNLPEKVTLEVLWVFMNSQEMWSSNIVTCFHGHSSRSWFCFLLDNFFLDSCFVCLLFIGGLFYLCGRNSLWRCSTISFLWSWILPLLLGEVCTCI